MVNATVAQNMRGRIRIDSEKIERPHFPLIMFFVALTKDLLVDTVIFALTVVGTTVSVIPFAGFLGVAINAVGWVFGIVLSFVFTMIFLLWYFLRNTATKARVWKRFIIMAAIAAFVGFIPVVRFLIPEFTLIVLITHSLELKEYRRLSVSRVS